MEFQIRTAEMHRINEYGVAAHWLYKEPGKTKGRDEEVFSWLRQFVEWHKDLSDNRQFMDSVKLDLFHYVVFVFTPKGEVREVPVGSALEAVNPHLPWHDLPDTSCRCLPEETHRRNSPSR